MVTKSSLPFDGVLKNLSWDSQHFGFPVAQIASPTLSDAELRDALRQARAYGTRLVYWATRPDRPVPDALLREYGGVLADRKLTFRAELSSPACFPTPPVAGIQVQEYPPGPASDGLQGLALAAGHLSRFIVDPRMPRQQAENLYRTWMQRSARHELADAVFAAVESANPGDHVGMVTVSLKQAAGWIGLIAVAERLRGRGIGALLLREAHRWMVNQGATEAFVVTQETNVGACKLYESAGYRRHDLQHFYHFWPVRAAAA
jgi:GNAT superfamily N-acetyltransferase